MSSFVRLSAAVALVGLLLGVATPARGEIADGDDDAPTLVPHWVHRRRPGLIAAGAATFGASYATAVLLGLATWASGAAEPCSDCRSRGMVAVAPVAGPLLYWSKAPAYDRGSPVWWSVWSGVQAVGAGMLIAGLVGHDVLEWRPQYIGATMHLAPALAPSHGALSLVVSW